MSIIQVNKSITEHFDYDEEWIRCKCCDTLRISDQFFKHMAALEGLRVELGSGLRIVSGYRCKKHNKEVGGAESSQHLIFATDVKPITNDDRIQFKADLSLIVAMAPDYGFTGIGVDDSFIHLDMRHTQKDRPVIRWTYGK